MMTGRAFSRGGRRGLLRAGGGRGDLQMQTGHVWNVGQPRARTIMGICHFGVSRYVQHLWNAEAQVLKGKGGGQMPPLPIPWQLGNERANWCFRLLSPGTLQGQLRGSQQPRRVAEAAGSLGVASGARQCGQCGPCQQRRPGYSLPGVATRHLGDSPRTFHSSGLQARLYDTTRRSAAQDNATSELRGDTRPTPAPRKSKEKKPEPHALRAPRAGLPTSVRGAFPLAFISDPLQTISFAQKKSNKNR